MPLANIGGDIEVRTLFFKTRGGAIGRFLVARRRRVWRPRLRRFGSDAIDLRGLYGYTYESALEKNKCVTR